jgi:hypothetical protein
MPPRRPSGEARHTRNAVRSLEKTSRPTDPADLVDIDIDV